MHRAPIAILLASVIVAGGVAVPATAASAAEDAPSILINELANGGPDREVDSFFELRNWSDEPVALDGWRIFRCSEQGLRANIGRQEVALTGITLQPGEIFTVSMVGTPGDMHIDSAFGQRGFGLYLESPDRRAVDVVGVYPNTPWPTPTECTTTINLPNRLNFALGESWQRVGATGDVTRDFIAAPATRGEPNATTATPRETTRVVIAEVASTGPTADNDEFVELENRGAQAEDISGWQLYRCLATGRLTPEALELTIPDGTVLAPGERWVIAGHGFTGSADARLGYGLSDVTFGVHLQTASGRIVDRIGVSSHRDTACQDSDVKVPAVADGVTGESYQRRGADVIVAPRTPGEPNATVRDAFVDQVFAYPDDLGVHVSELATDPSTAGMPAGSEQRNFIELGNYGRVPVDIGGWSVRRCEADGKRSVDLQFTVPRGTTLAPGEVFLAARQGTPLASSADITYATSLNLLGTGVWVADADGARVDSVGIFAANEMDSANIIPSPCSKGMALTTYLPDRLEAETFQRTRFTGNDVDDFVVRAATPGVIDHHDWVDPTARVVAAEPAAVGFERPRDHGVASMQGLVATVPLEGWSGVSANGPLATLVGEGEHRWADPAQPETVADDGYGIPYHRIVLDGAGLTVGSTIEWTGSGFDGGEQQLSVWSGAAWRRLDAGDDRLSGTLVAEDLASGTVTLLVEDGHREHTTLTEERDGALENPADYDFAVTHLTDTQYLSESYPEVYAQAVSWMADHADDRKISFVTHTGDLVQNWVDPDQNEDRARLEFERASAIQSILDDASIPNSVLPGNHDNKRGITDDLFNEYFPPSRYADESWYGGSIAPGDNSANFSMFEEDGARFLMLSLPYAYGEREIQWAETVVESHPDVNVIISTHEHVMPADLIGDTRRSIRSRWISQAGALWERVIAPNRNVVIVLSGHFHGLGQIVTENAGGLPGHTVVELLADYQEFRTHTGKRATGFFRMLQFDLDGQSIAVDTRSVRLAESVSHEYDYLQFLPENGDSTRASNNRPWNILSAGLQNRYTDADDEFLVTVELQHPKLIATTAILVSGPAAP